MKLFKLNKKILSTSFLLGVIIAGTYAPQAMAISQFFSDNDIIFYDPTASLACSPSGAVSAPTSAETDGSVAPTANLPQATIDQLDSQGINKLAEQSKEAYMAAEAEGVPWAVMAAVHYREATMNPNRSIADGGALGRSSSMDGIPVGGTLAEDVALQAKHFKEMAKSVYGIELSLESSGDDWGYAFLAYNRGFMYKNWNKTFTESPYVMNGYDESHINMRWNDADSYVKPGGKKLNSVSGKVNEQIGAMSVLAYLGGPTAAGVACSSEGGGGGVVQGNIVQTAMNLAWETPQKSHSSSNFKAESKPEFVSAMAQYNPGPANYLGHYAYADCGVFVSTVMRASGADPEFPEAGTSTIMPYLKNSSKYTNLGTPDPSKLQPGDLLIYRNGSGGHISIYSGPIGEYNGEQITMIDASLRKRVPSYRTNSQLMWMVGVPGVEAFRLNQ